VDDDSSINRKISLQKTFEPILQKLSRELTQIIPAQDLGRLALAVDRVVRLSG